MTARNKVLTIMGIIILIGIISIGFFVFPIGISMCAITGLCYGCKYKETRPIMDGFRKNNVNYWVFREIRSIIPHL